MWVFLDVYGVLNTRTTVKRTPYGYTGIDDARVEILAKAIEKYGNCEIILSSDWKELNEKHEDYKKLWERLLITDGIERAEFASRTPAIEAILFRDYIKSF